MSANVRSGTACLVHLFVVGRMREEASGQELKIKEVDTRIEREIAELRTAIQASKVRPTRLLKRTECLQGN